MAGWVGAIRDLHGSLFPFGWAKLLWRLKVRYPRSARIPLMGVRKKYQHSRLGPTVAFMISGLVVLSTGVAALLGGVDAVVCGTGLGQGDWSRLVLDACIAAGRPTVLDADGLNLVAERRRGSDAPILQGGRWILTPHPAEAGRLLGCSAGEIQADRVGAAQRLAARYQAVVVLKGCGTVVADADGRYAICPLGNPGMATAGSGDVLSGVIGAMLAQGLSPWQAAQAGVVAHAAAGDLAAEQHGQRGLLASDISAFLPLVLNPV